MENEEKSYCYRKAPSSYLIRDIVFVKASVSIGPVIVTLPHLSAAKRNDTSRLYLSITTKVEAGSMGMYTPRSASG